MTYGTTTLLSVAALAAILSGCSQVEEVTNQGGDTSCEDYLAADEAEQNESITKMLTDEGKNEPANTELAGTRLSVTTYCQTVGTPESTIKEAPHL
ncbi:MAG: hypothetical protein WBB00_02070 [Mycobacterium sp.]